MSIIFVVLVNALFLYSDEGSIFGVLDFSICGYSLGIIIMYYGCFRFAEYNTIRELAYAVLENVNQGAATGDDRTSGDDIYENIRSIAYSRHLLDENDRIIEVDQDFEALDSQKRRHKDTGILYGKELLRFCGNADTYGSGHVQRRIRERKSA